MIWNTTANCLSVETEKTSTPYKTCWECRVNDERPTGKKNTSIEWNEGGPIGIKNNFNIMCLLITIEYNTMQILISDILKLHMSLRKQFTFLIFLLISQSYEFARGMSVAPNEGTFMYLSFVALNILQRENNRVKLLVLLDWTNG